MNLEPPTRYFHFNLVLRVFPQHREAIRRELNAGAQRYVVSDLRAIREMTQRPISLSYEPLGLPPDFPPALAHLFPWYEPVVFHAGRYLVHRMTQPVGKFFPDSPRQPKATSFRAAPQARHTGGIGSQPAVIPSSWRRFCLRPLRAVAAGQRLLRQRRADILER
jgi:hypothetical protein